MMTDALYRKTTSGLLNRNSGYFIYFGHKFELKTSEDQKTMLQLTLFMLTPKKMLKLVYHTVLVKNEGMDEFSLPEGAMFEIADDIDVKMIEEFVYNEHHKFKYNSGKSRVFFSKTLNCVVGFFYMETRNFDSDYKIIVICLDVDNFELLLVHEELKIFTVNKHRN